MNDRDSDQANEETEAGANDVSRFGGVWEWGIVAAAVLGLALVESLGDLVARLF